MMDQQVYLDYCATTPVHPQVREAVLEALADFGNPSSMHWAGRGAGRRLGRAREQAAQAIGAQPEEIVFTSGATEADNLALFGVLRQRKPGNAHLITTAIEHHAILHAAEALEQEGYSVTILPVDRRGLVSPQQVQEAIRPETALISVMLVNNEMGAIQPVAEIGHIAWQHGILMHTDAVQAAGLFEIDVDALHVDLLSLSAHKIYGPKGVGALYLRRSTQLAPQIVGGPQEHLLRAGTENVPGIAGLGAALELVGTHKAAERQRIAVLRAEFIRRLSALIPGIAVNGPNRAAPHILSISFPQADAEAMLMRFTAAGIAVSLGSACNSKAVEPSHVLSAMGLKRDQIESTLRISFGYPTTPADVEAFFGVVEDIYSRSVLS
jgi:cysteine desulfurase